MTGKQFIAKFYGLGIAIGAVIAWIQNPLAEKSYTNASGRTINCAGWADPNYPMDGRGPCTDILNGARTWFFIGVALIGISLVAYAATKNETECGS